MTLWFCDLSTSTGSAFLYRLQFQAEEDITAGLSFLPHGRVGGVRVCPWNCVVKTIPLAVSWRCCASVPLGYRPQSGKGLSFSLRQMHT